MASPQFGRAPPDCVGLHAQRCRTTEPCSLFILQLRLCRASAARVCAGTADAPKHSGSVHGEDKDTLRNIRETKEFVINVVTYELAEAMNLTSGEYDASINEFELAQIASAPSQIVKVPRVAESPVSFECKLYQILDFSPSPQSGSLVIGEIVSIHVDDAHLKEGKLDRNSLDLIGRMGGIQYTRTTQRFEMVRPKVG